MGVIARYEWMTIDPDGTMHGDMTDTSPAEMDRRMVIMQEVQVGRLVLADEHRGAVEALRMLADLHHRTTVGSRLHDPENRDWTECECESCQLAQAIVGGQSEALAPSVITARADVEIARLREAVVEARYYVARCNQIEGTDESRRWLLNNPGSPPAVDETLAPCPICDGTGHGEPLGDQSGYVPCDSCGGTGKIDADTARRYRERSGALREQERADG